MPPPFAGLVLSPAGGCLFSIVFYLNKFFMNSLKVPKDGLSGLIENFKADSLSGFMVFLLALPLSLGIAKASVYSASQGFLTAMIGGLLVGLFQGGQLTIKGPAAGLVTVCAGTLADK